MFQGARWLPVLLVLAGCGGGGGGGGGDDGDPYEPPAGTDVRLDTDPPGAALSVFPQVAGDGTRVYVVWYDRRDGATDVRFNRSLDGGATWLAADLRLNTDLPGAAASDVPRIAADGDRVYVAWSDTRGGPSQVRFNRSLDAGSTWLAEDLRLDRPAPDGSSFDVAVACDGLAVYVAWEDRQSGAGDVHLARSADGGSTWPGGDVRLDTDVAGAARSAHPRLACAGGRVHAVWHDERDGAADVRYQVSTDGGATWLPEDRRLDTDLPGDAASIDPVLAVEGGEVLVLWSDARDGAADLFANVSADGGDTWLAADLRVEGDAPGTADSLRASVARRGAEVHVAWQDLRSGNGSPDVYANRSTDGGRTWAPVDLRLDLGAPGAANSVGPAVALLPVPPPDAGPAPVVVAWADDRDGRFDVLLRSSLDGGVTWSVRETRLDTDLPPGAADSLAPALLPGPGTVHAVWYDARDGEPDVRWNRWAP